MRPGAARLHRCKPRRRFAVRRAACRALTEEYTHASTSDRPLTAALVACTIGLTAGTAAAAPASAAAPAASAIAAAPTSLAVPVNQTIDGVGTFAGTFTPTRFSGSNSALTVRGVLAGTFTSVDGVVTTVNQVITAAAQVNNSTCTILDLVLGPLHLDLLGLVVDLNQVHLTITAQQGAGNLLGNLLCAIANLLNGGATGGLATLLNRILGLLGGV